MRIIREYITVPDTANKGVGIVAGGALSTLLGAVYLSPLDSVMNELYQKGDIFYLRYVDDIVILAKTRWKFKKAVKLMHETLDSLQLSVHVQKKRFVGKTSKGFDCLGYYFKLGRKVKPSKKFMERFAKRAIQLLEQGDLNSGWEKTPYFLGKYVFELKKIKKLLNDSFLIVINSESLLYYFYKLSVFLPIGRRIQRKPSKRIRILKTFDGFT